MMTEFHNRQTGLIHTILHSPDGGAVYGTHRTLEEAHAWAKSGAHGATPPQPGTSDTFTHRVDSPDGKGELLGSYKRTGIQGARGHTQEVHEHIAHR